MVGLFLAANLRPIYVGSLSKILRMAPSLSVSSIHVHKIAKSIFGVYNTVPQTMNQRIATAVQCLRTDSHL